MVSPVRRYREERHLTQPELAALLGVSLSRAMQLDLGYDMPTHMQVEKLAVAAGVPRQRLEKEIAEFLRQRRRTVRKKLAARSHQGWV
jgi:transcriptional regulator with XRE-family HTH domain